MFIVDLILKNSAGPPCSGVPEFQILSAIYSFKIFGIEKGICLIPSAYTLK